MQVGVGVLWHVVVEHDVHALDVHAAAEQVRRDQNSLKTTKKDKFLLPGIEARSRKIN
jgi:hypothetical protein